MHAALVALMMTMTAAGGPWQLIAPGAERLRLEDPRLELFRFDLETYRPEVMVPGPENPRSAAALRAEAGAVAAINGGFFDEKWRSLGMRIGRGKTLIRLRPRVDW